MVISGWLMSPVIQVTWPTLCRGLGTYVLLALPCWLICCIVLPIKYSFFFNIAGYQEDIRVGGLRPSTFPLFSRGLSQRIFSQKTGSSGLTGFRFYRTFTHAPFLNPSFSKRPTIAVAKINLIVKMSAWTGEEKTQYQENDTSSCCVLWTRAIICISLCHIWSRLRSVWLKSYLLHKAFIVWPESPSTTSTFTNAFNQVSSMSPWRPLRPYWRRDGRETPFRPEFNQAVSSERHVVRFWDVKKKKVSGLLTHIINLPCRHPSPPWPTIDKVLSSDWARYVSIMSSRISLRVWIFWSSRSKVVLERS